MPKKNEKLITKRKFTGNIWILAILVVVTIWTWIGLVIPLAYWYFASETVTEKVTG